MSRFELACLALRGALDAYEEALVAYRESKKAPPLERRALADMVDMTMEIVRARAKVVEVIRKQMAARWESDRA